MITPTTGELIVDIKNVSLSFGETMVLRDLSASIYDLRQPDGPVRGQIVALLAPSGMGKSQLCRILCGLQAPTSGEVLVGREMIRPTPRDVGLVAQKYPLFEHRTVLGNLTAAQSSLPRTRAEKEAAAQAMLARFGLQDRAGFYPKQISGGQRQRVAIAQQLLSSSQFILMDEPFSGLDPIAMSEVIKLIIEVADADELNTVVVVTHDIAAAVAVADQVWLLGCDRDEDGTTIPGARVQRTFELISRGLAWIDGDVRRQPGFHELVDEINDSFRQL